MIIVMTPSSLVMIQKMLLLIAAIKRNVIINSDMFEKKIENYLEFIRFLNFFFYKKLHFKKNIF